MYDRSHTIKQRFEVHYTPEPNSGCWLWEIDDVNGYGRFHMNGGRILAHRAAYEIHIGPIPSGLNVLHKCDMPCCVNPDHLFLGTHSDNMKDKVNKGRGNPPRGERNKLSKLTETNVLKIFSDSRGPAEISRDYNVTPECIGLIKSGKNWRWLTHPEDAQMR